MVQLIPYYLYVTITYILWLLWQLCWKHLLKVAAQFKGKHPTGVLYCLLTILVITNYILWISLTYISLWLHLQVTDINMQFLLKSAFPKLEAGGGVEYLRVQERSQRKLMVVAAGPIPAEDLRGISTGRCYVRPIQKDLEMDPSKSIGTSAQYSSEKCFKCGNLISISILRQHVQQCQDPEANSVSIPSKCSNWPLRFQHFKLTWAKGS